jgi:hypothetical protein
MLTMAGVEAGIRTRRLPNSSTKSEMLHLQLFAWLFDPVNWFACILSVNALEDFHTSAYYNVRVLRKNTLQANQTLFDHEFTS